MQNQPTNQRKAPGWGGKKKKKIRTSSFQEYWTDNLRATTQIFSGFLKKSLELYF